MLSKELKVLEANGINKRTVYDTIPVTVEYELTDSGYSFKLALDVMVESGLQHRITPIHSYSLRKDDAGFIMADLID